MTVWGRHGFMLTGSLFPLVFGGLEYQGKLGKICLCKQGRATKHISGENGSLKWSILFGKQNVA